MASPFDFLDLPRRTAPRRPIPDRILDDLPVELPLAEPEVAGQARRCMSCGVPFCQAGCPLGNPIPDFNEAVREGRWRAAFDLLSGTNNFPEFTGRICPAPCETACVVGLVAEPVTIEQVERTIAEHAFREGWITPNADVPATGNTVAVVGSGPAGLAAAAQLASVGHAVTVYERDDRPGGLLRYGVPDFKLDKAVVDRRLDVMRASGVRFECGVEIGVDLTYDALREAHDAVVLCTGATRAREVDVPGRELAGIHTAWDYLTGHAKHVAGDLDRPPISAAGKRVIVVGGGDTASDCIGVAHRQGAASVVSFQIQPLPPADVPRSASWPFQSYVLTVSSSHEEGGDRVWSVSTQEFLGEHGHVTGVRTLDAATSPEGRWYEIEGTERLWEADLVVIAIGYAGPDTQRLVEQTPVALDGAGRIHAATQYATAAEGIFAAGDARRGASLVVWAISEGREAARAVDTYLMGSTRLPAKGDGDLPRQ